VKCKLYMLASGNTQPTFVREVELREPLQPYIHIREDLKKYQWGTQLPIARAHPNEQVYKYNNKLSQSMNGPAYLEVVL
jgi:hypothetical protein